MKFLAATVRTSTCLALLTAALTACNTGTKSGDTNVERGADKSHDPTAVNPMSSAADSTTAGLRPDTTHRVTGQEIYKESSNAKDRNNDGIAD